MKVKKSKKLRKKKERERKKERKKERKEERKKDRTEDRKRFACIIIKKNFEFIELHSKVTDFNFNV